MDSKTANRQLGRAFFTEQDARRGEVAPELCAAGYIARIGTNPPMDHQAHSAFGRAFQAAFPDLHHEIEQVLVDDDVVVVRFTLHGTQQGAFFGIPATGRTISVPAHVILKVSAGKVASLLGVFDEAGMLRQLGILPGG
jgi:steroid delta-isomerase-like uncharacterized protein